MTQIEPNTKISIFKGQKIRKTLHNDEWWFSVIDVVKALTEQLDSLKARKYWNKLAQRLRGEGSEVVTFCHQLKLAASDGKKYKTMLRLIQSIPSKKGGQIAGGAREKLELETKKKVSTSWNYLQNKKN